MRPEKSWPLYQMEGDLAVQLAKCMVCGVLYEDASGRAHGICGSKCHAIFEKRMNEVNEEGKKGGL